MPIEDPVITSLEYAAEAEQDVSREVYQRFAAREPDSAALMSHMDEYMLGRMMQDVLTLIMTPPGDVDQKYLSFEVGSHRAYGVSPDMFPPLLRTVQDVLREQLGAAWTAEMEQAWSARIDALREQIELAAQGAT